MLRSGGKYDNTDIYNIVKIETASNEFAHLAKKISIQNPENSDWFLLAVYAKAWGMTGELSNKLSSY